MLPVPLYSTWFEVHLTAPGNLDDHARALDQALRKEGHDAWLACDLLGYWFLAASIQGPTPQRLLEQALRRGGRDAETALTKTPAGPDLV